MIERAPATRVASRLQRRWPNLLEGEDAITGDTVGTGSDDWLRLDGGRGAKRVDRGARPALKGASPGPAMPRGLAGSAAPRRSEHRRGIGLGGELEVVVMHGEELAQLLAGDCLLHQQHLAGAQQHLVKP